MLDICLRSEFFYSRCVVTSFTNPATKLLDCVRHTHLEEFFSSCCFFSNLTHLFDQRNWKVGLLELLLFRLDLIIKKNCQFNVLLKRWHLRMDTHTDTHTRTHARTYAHINSVWISGIRRLSLFSVALMSSSLLLQIKMLRSLCSPVFFRYLSIRLKFWDFWTKPLQFTVLDVCRLSNG